MRSTAAPAQWAAWLRGKRAAGNSMQASPGPIGSKTGRIESSRFRRRADDLQPAGRRSGEGSDSLLPYLTAALASKPLAGPPGGLERRARPRER